MKEVELRSFITEKRYNELIDFFTKNSKLVSVDDQETHYLDCKEDLRIQKNRFYSKVWLKKGKLHDDSREEIEIRFGRDDFDSLSEIFKSIGLGVEIKWFRKRHTFEWEGINVMLDYTRGYGYILELEILTENDEKKALDRLRQKFNELGIEITSKEEFNQRYEDYKNNWNLKE